MSAGLRLLAALVDHEDGADQYARLRLDESMFMGEAEIDAHALVYNHFTQYGKLPSRKTLKEAGTSLPTKQEEPPKFYFDKLRERYVFYRLKGMLEHVETDLNDDRPAKALDAMAETMALCQLFLNRERIFDYRRDALDIVANEYKRKLIGGTDYGLMMGWPTLDLMTGGLGGGDMVSIVGRPGAGKTYLMLHAANSAWLSGRTPLFITMEMKPLLIMQRQTAMLARLPITGLKHSALPLKQQERMQSYLRKARKHGCPYWVVDGALTATVDDIILLARQLKAGSVFIDGAYLLRNRNTRLGRWERLTENAERIKGEIAEGLDVPTVISYQLNRETKKQKKDEVGLENIAYTDAIGQLSSIVLAQLEEDSVETLIRRRIEILKGRSGERGHFNIHWGFDEGPEYMNFTEIPPPKEGAKEQPPPELDYI